MFQSPASSFDARVAQGVAYLNVFQPDWFKGIDLATLDISSGTTCALAQLAGGSWQKAIRAHSAIDNESAMQPLGFCERSGPDRDLRYQQLTKAWRRAIIALCAGTYIGIVSTEEALAA